MSSVTKRQRGLFPYQLSKLGKTKDSEFSPTQHWIQLASLLGVLVQKAVKSQVKYAVLTRGTVFDLGTHIRT